MERSQVASLWIGKRLSFLDLLCLKSFDDISQRVTLFSYSPIENLPSYVTQADARSVYDPERILLQRVGNGFVRRSPALHSDIFRLHLLEKTNFIWADTDAYALKPLITTNGYLFGRVGSNILNGVLALPKDSNTLKKMLEFSANDNEFPPWWDQPTRRRHLEKNLPIQPEFFPWGTYGPRALQYFLGETGEAIHASRSDVLYPVKARHRDILLTRSEIEIPKRALSIHLYSTNLRAVIRRNFGGKIPEGCFLHRLCEKHGIDPHEAPL